MEVTSHHAGDTETRAVRQAATAGGDRPTAWTTGLIRTGILALPLGAVLKLLGNIGTFDSIGYGIPRAAEAATATSPAFFLGELAGSVVPVLLGIFGVFALFAYLAPRAPARAAGAGLVCTVLGSGITLLGLGVINFAIPALGAAYEDGHHYAMVVADSFFTWPRGAMLYPAVLYPIGIICFAVAIWRSAALPRTAGISLALTSVLVAIPVPLHAVRLAGGALGLFVGVWVAHLVRQRVPNATPVRESVASSASTII